MKPNGENVPTNVVGIYDEDGNSKESAPHPQEKLFLNLCTPPKQGDICKSSGKEIDYGKN